jgi:hypothetical protein
MPALKLSTLSKVECILELTFLLLAGDIDPKRKSYNDERYDDGNNCGSGGLHRLELLPRENDCAEDRYEDEDACHFKRQKQ